MSRNRFVAPIHWSGEPDIELVVTDEQLRRAKSFGAVGYVWMHTMDFLLLTTPDDSYIDDILEHALPLDIYNRFTRDREISVMPFLDIDFESGEVEGHEGRHRAGALYKLDPSAKMRVAIVLKEGSYKLYYRELSKPPWTKTFLTVKDIPPVLHTEDFRKTTTRFAHIPINLNNSKDFWSTTETSEPV